MATAFLLAGCAAPVAPAPATGSAGPPIPAPNAAAPIAASSPAVAPAPTPSGTSSLRIGVIESLQGAYASLGQDNLDGLNLYLSSVDNTVSGRRIELDVVDDQVQADVGATKARQLVENDHVPLVMGAHLTATCYAVAPYIRDQQVPLLVSGNCPGTDLTTNPAYSSPYLLRVSFTPTALADTLADHAIQQGLRKAATIGTNTAGGLESTDLFAHAFIARGGSIVQQQYPDLTVTDYAPIVTAIDPSADVVVGSMAGTAGLRFLDAFRQFGNQQLPFYDLYGASTSATNVAQLKDAAIGVVASNFYSPAISTQMNQDFLKLAAQKYPGRAASSDLAEGFASGQMLAALIQQVQGNVENKPGLLNALHSLKVETVKGPVTLDQYGDVVQNTYITQIEKQGDGYGQKILQTYPTTSQFWDRPLASLLALRAGTMKDRWVGMTREQLAQQDPSIDATPGPRPSETP